VTIERHEPGELYAGLVVHCGTVHLCKVDDDCTQDVRGQTRQVLAEIDRTLALCGSNRSRLLQVTVWLKDIADFGAMNEVYGAWIDRDNLPCRATVQSALAGEDILVEIKCVAAR